MATVADLRLLNRSTRPRLTVRPTDMTPPRASLRCAITVAFSFYHLLLTPLTRSLPLHHRNTTHRHPARLQSGHRSETKPVLPIYANVLYSVDSIALWLCDSTPMPSSYFTLLVTSCCCIPCASCTTCWLVTTFQTRGTMLSSHCTLCAHGHHGCLLCTCPVTG
jgi:hypothetical protein